jgi:hypothetical protein
VSCLVGSEIVELLYSPVKAFKKIVEKPDFKAVILILVVVASVMMVQQYVASSKLYLENRMPEDDDWTENLLIQDFWESNGVLSLDNSDYKMGNDDGNHSISAFIMDNTSIWMRLEDIDSLNCSEADGGYVELFFWLKWANAENTTPTSGTLKLYSGDDAYFEADISGFLGASGEWVNATLDLGPSGGWTTSGSVDWMDIVGLEFSLGWDSATNTTVNVDGVFFRNYVSPLEDGSFVDLLPSLTLQVVLNLGMNWILWAGILILVAKLFNEDLGPWQGNFVIIGYSFIATAVYTLINIVPLFGLPALNVPMDAAALSALLDVTWRPLLAYQLWLYIPIFGEVWIAALGAVAVRVIKGEELMWNKAITIAVVAFGLRFVLRLFLGF